MARVQLLFFPGCPHIDAARTQLRKAFELAGLAPTWTEHDVTLTTTPPEFRGYGSPTVLVDGRDVMGVPPGDAVACRLYLGSDLSGAPPLQDVVSALSGK